MNTADGAGSANTADDQTGGDAVRPGVVLFDRYRLVRFVAAGGMGTVWEAFDEFLDQTVAVKHVTFARLGLDEAKQTRDRTVREARNAAQLRGQASVVAIYDVQVTDTDIWLVLEYVPSRSLADLLAAGDRLDVHHAARVGADIATALAAAHARGIVHRDVKPGNILIPDDGSPAKLTDFGISHAEGIPQITATDLISGTPAFMAREVARGEEATPESDVYSLGATLYAAVEGTSPFGEGNARQLIYRVATAEMRPPVAAGPFRPLLMRLLEADPPTRPSAATAARLLTEFARNPGQPTLTNGPAPQPTALLSDPPPSPPPAAARKTGWRRGTIIAAVAVPVALVAVAILLASMFTGPRADVPVPTADTIVGLPQDVKPVSLSGDPRTVEPCNLINPTALASFGRILVTPEGATPNACYLYVQTTGQPNHTIAVEFDTPSGVLTQGTDTRLGGITVRKGGPVPSTEPITMCRNEILLTNGYGIEVYTTRFSADPAPPCAMNDAATATVAQELARNGVPYDARRNSRFGLRTADPCALIPAPDLGAVLGGPGSVHPGFGQWSCRLVRRDTTVTVSLATAAPGTKRGVPSTVNGKTAYTDTANGECTVAIDHRSPPAAPSLEVVKVKVKYSATSPPQICAQATSLAVTAERNVPPPPP